MTELLTAEDVKDEDLKRLSPCPFCGGGITEFRNNGQVWIGTKYSDPTSVSVRHWCEETPGPGRMIERIGRNKNRRLNGGTRASTCRVKG